MKCEDWRGLMEEAVDGEMNPQDLLRLQDHVEGCQECAHRYLEMQGEMKLYAGYERGLGSTAELWDGVLVKIRERRNEHRFSLAKLKRWITASFEGYRFSPVLTAALVLISIAGTIVVMKYRDLRSNGAAREAIVTSQVSPNQSSAQAPSAADKEERSMASQGAVQGNATSHMLERPKTAAHQPSVEQLVQEAESKYLTAIALIEKDLRRKSSHLDPAVRARLEETIAAIDLNIEETRRVVSKNPEDPVAVQFMLTAYAKKVEVLKELANL
jgi:hypothetical protein